MFNYDFIYQQLNQLRFQLNQNLNNFTDLFKKEIFRTIKINLFKFGDDESMHCLMVKCIVRYFKLILFIVLISLKRRENEDK